MDPPGAGDRAERAQMPVRRHCPSFPGDTGFYCARGESPGEVAEQGCKCSSCENFEEFHLSKGYYCKLGAAKRAEIETQ